MADRLTKKDKGPFYFTCPNCGGRGVNFLSVGFACAGGCSASAAEITECGDDIKKLRRILRKNRERNLKFERGSWDKKTRKKAGQKGLRKK